MQRQVPLGGSGCAGNCRCPPAVHPLATLSFQRRRCSPLVVMTAQTSPPPDATSPVVADGAANTNIAVFRRTTQKRPPHGPKPQRKSHRLHRPRLPARCRDARLPIKRISPGRQPRLVASCRARARHAKWAAAERGFHRILRATRATEAGVADHVSSVEEIVVGPLADSGPVRRRRSRSPLRGVSS